MGDAFKCKNCGTVVETPRSCPSCGETAMRPVQSPADSDVVSETGESAETVAETDDSAAGASQSDEPQTATEPANTDDPDGASVRSRDTPGQGRRDESGLLAWLKSLF